MKFRRNFHKQDVLPFRINSINCSLLKSLCGMHTYQTSLYYFFTINNKLIWLVAKTDCVGLNQIKFTELPPSTTQICKATTALSTSSVFTRSYKRLFMISCVFKSKKQTTRFWIEEQFEISQAVVSNYIHRVSLPLWFTQAKLQPITCLPSIIACV